MEIGGEEFEIMMIMGKGIDLDGFHGEKEREAKGRSRIWWDERRKGSGVERKGIWMILVWLVRDMKGICVLFIVVCVVEVDKKNKTNMAIEIRWNEKRQKLIEGRRRRRGGSRGSRGSRYWRTGRIIRIIGRWWWIWWWWWIRGRGTRFPAMTRSPLLPSQLPFFSPLSLSLFMFFFSLFVCLFSLLLSQLFIVLPSSILIIRLQQQCLVNQTLSRLRIEWISRNHPTFS